MNDSIVTQVVEHLQELPENLQRQVLDFVQSLKSTSEEDMPGTKLLHFVGSISQEDLSAMQQAIDTDCEHVDENE